MGLNKETWELTLPVYSSQRRELEKDLDFITFMKDRSPDEQLDRVLTDFFTSMSGDSKSFGT
jgi:hypothetical protein